MLLLLLLGALGVALCFQARSSQVVLQALLFAF